MTTGICHFRVGDQVEWDSSYTRGTLLRGVIRHVGWFKTVYIAFVSVADSKPVMVSVDRLHYAGRRVAPAPGGRAA